MSNHRNAAATAHLAEARPSAGATAAGWVLILAVLTGGGFAARDYAHTTCPTAPATAVCQALATVHA